MPRTVRVKSSTGIYHVLARGINQQRIFEDDADFATYLEVVARVKREIPFTLFAYCLMSNHVHLLLRDDDESLSRILQRIGVSYAYRFNQRHERTGHLFQDRFKSEPVEDDGYFATVLRYIHRNPVKAGLCQSADQYRWGSCHRLGRPDSLVDEASLYDIVPAEEIAPLLAATEEKAEPFEAAPRGRRQRMGDDEAMALLKAASGVASSGAFQRLAKEDQRRAVSELSARGSSIRQIARITGLSKGGVEAWRAASVG
ncbi:REP-associated tyrosine transposase [Eggerthella sinensis]|uniref:REP-associated tyrosine transposase n=1 Tax=Eggerthella sinensis TaxID=242230 RepID=UPI0022E18EF8|nr:transposase [Eggerthella sinensis]